MIPTRFRALDGGPCVVAILTAEECWRLLERKTFGRIAIADGRRVEIFPVTYDAVEETIVFRCAPGAKLALLAGSADVAFEVDGGEGAVRWSVVLHGSAAPMGNFVRITPVAITGRAFRAVPAGAREDRRTASRVRHALRRARSLDASGVDVTVDAGFVTLSGEVGSVDERLVARLAARDVPEVLGVDDLLTFRLAPLEGKALRAGESGLLRWHRAVSRRVDGGLRAPLHAELREQFRHVVLDGLLGETEAVADLPVGETTRDQVENLALP
jgi:hypothetical protein